MKLRPAVYPPGHGGDGGGHGGAAADGGGGGAAADGGGGGAAAGGGGGGLLEGTPLIWPKHVLRELAATLKAANPDSVVFLPELGEEVVIPAKGSNAFVPTSTPKNDKDFAAYEALFGSTSLMRNNLVAETVVAIVPKQYEYPVNIKVNAKNCITSGRASYIEP